MASSRVMSEIEELRAQVARLTAQREAEQEAWTAVITFLEEYCSNEGRKLASGKRALRSVRGAVAHSRALELVDNGPCKLD